jgi:hypothetical protein
MADIATLNTSNTPKETQNSPFSPAPKKPELTMDQKMFGGFGWDTSEFLDNDRVQQNKAPQTPVSGSIDLKVVTNEAVGGLAKTTVKATETVGVAAMDVASASNELFRKIIGAETFSYTTVEQPKTQAQYQEAQKKAEDHQAIEYKKQWERAIEISITQVSLEQLREQTLRVLENGAAMSEQQKRKRLNLQEGFTGELTIYHITELRAALVEDEQSVKQDQAEKSMNSHGRNGNLDLNKAAEGGSQLSMASGQAAG